MYTFMRTYRIGLYYITIHIFQDPTFRARIEADTAAEKKRNAELVKREKQLKSQIDNLINDSLGLLKTRLRELGIQAKTPPEFIEKAKGIVSSHHELQRSKASLEREIRQLEEERAALLASKENELVERMVRERKDMHPARIREFVKKEVDAAAANGGGGGGNPGGVSATVAPLLNKLSDVTFTKCSSTAAVLTSASPSASSAAAAAAAAAVTSEQITTQIRKRPREHVHKQRDWPEKRAKTAGAGDWHATTMAKIEEKNPEVLAKKILEQGRTLEKSHLHHHNHHHHRTAAATLTISPTKSSSQQQQHYHNSGFPPHHSGHLGAPGVEVRKIEAPMLSPPPPSQHQHQQHYNRSPPGKPGAILPPGDLPPGAGRPPIVDLPKMDLSMSIAAAPSSSSGAPPPPPSSGVAPPPPPLVLPPHPDSRSPSSEQTDDLTYQKSKMSATPRAEQFEDRLKSIIHSVLSSDAEPGNDLPKRGPPPAAHSAAGPGRLSQHGPPPPPPPAHSRGPPPGMLPSSSSAHHGGPPPPPPPQQQQPMFSPVKKELPSHLPPPPNTHSSGGGGGPRFTQPTPPPPPSAHHYPPSSSPYGPSVGPPPGSLPPPPPPHHGHPHGPMPAYPPRHGRPPASSPSSLPSPSTSRTMSDLISSEMDRTLPPPLPPPGRHAAAPPGLPSHSRAGGSRPYTEPAGIPGNPREYLPRSEAPTMLRMSQVIEDSIRGHVKASELEGLACPRTKSPPPPRASASHQPGPPPPPPASSSGVGPRPDYPAMEGLAARFGPYMDRTSKADRFDRRAPPTSSPMALHDPRRPLSASSLPGSGGRPPQPSPLPSPPILPPKKQHLDDHPDYRLPKGERK